MVVASVVGRDDFGVEGAVTVTVEPTGHVNWEAAAITVTVEGWIEAADWVSVTVWPVAAGQVDEPAIVTVEVPPGRVIPGAVTVTVGPAMAEPETVAIALLVTVTVLDTVVVTAEQPFCLATIPREGARSAPQCVNGPQQSKCFTNDRDSETKTRKFILVVLFGRICGL